MESVSGTQPAVKQPQSSPETRYSDLHRRIEAGDQAESNWIELAKICLDLGKNDEAVEAYRKLVSFGPRARIRTLLVDAKLLDETVESGSFPTSCVTDDDMQPNLLDGVWDALQFLVRDRVPLAALAVMAAFGSLFAIGGIAHGMGGILASTIVVLPIAIALYGYVAAVSARILMESLRGIDDPPELPTRDEGIAEGKTVAPLLLVTTLVLLAPGILSYWILPMAGIPAILLCLGWALVPFVFSIRLLSDSWRESGLARCWAILRCTNPHVLSTIVASLFLFAPTALIMCGALARPAYLGLSFAGLLSVMPLLATSRMLGQAIYYKRKSLGGTLDLARFAKR